MKKYIVVVLIFTFIIGISISYIIFNTNINNNVNLKDDSNHYEESILLLKLKGKRYINENKLDSIKFILDKISPLDTSIEVKIFRLYNYLITNDTKEFERLLIECQSINSNDIFFLTNMGNILLDKNLYKEALPYYLTADSLSENKNVIIIVNLSVVYTGLGENNKAIDILTNAIVNNNQVSELYYCRAVAYYNLDKKYDAVVDLNTAIDLDKVNPNYYHLRGTILNETGNSKAGKIDLDLAYKYGYQVSE